MTPTHISSLLPHRLHHYNIVVACKLKNLKILNNLLSELYDDGISDDRYSNYHPYYHVILITCSFYYKKGNIYNDMLFDCAKWLLSVKPDIDLCQMNNHLFKNACSRGHLKIAKWILSKRPDIIVLLDNEVCKYTTGEYEYTGCEYSFSLFVQVCKKGYLKMAKWLFSISIFIHRHRQTVTTAFTESCIRGKLTVAKWILSIRPDLLHETKNTHLFLEVCRNRRLNVARWFSTMNPYLYKIEVHAPKNGKNWTGIIIAEKEGRWQNKKWAVWAASDRSTSRDSILYKLPTDVSRYLLTNFI